MIIQLVHCPYGQGTDIIQYDKSHEGKYCYLRDEGQCRAVAL
jgi:hypothetical protein